MTVTAWLCLAPALAAADTAESVIKNTAQRYEKAGPPLPDGAFGDRLRQCYRAFAANERRITEGGVLDFSYYVADGRTGPNGAVQYGRHAQLAPEGLAFDDPGLIARVFRVPRRRLDRQLPVASGDHLISQNGRQGWLTDVP